jgi:hypothetical protein
MKKLIASIQTLAVIGGTALLVPSVALAQAANPFQNAQSLSQNVGQQAGVGNQQDLPVIVGRVINILLGFIGIILLLLILYAGFLWMTAQGDDGRVKKARAIISNAVVGLIILVAAFAISNFVLGSLINVTQ